MSGNSGIDDKLHRDGDQKNPVRSLSEGAGMGPGQGSMGVLERPSISKPHALQPALAPLARLADVAWHHLR